MGVAPLLLTHYTVKKQLRKLDQNNKNRMAIIRTLKHKIPNLYYSINNKKGDINVGTFLPLKIQNCNIHKLILETKRQGLLLRATWPAFQKYTMNQKTENILLLSLTLVILEINPYLTKKEIDKIAFLLKQI
jgi:hypothetical protein